MLFPIPKGDEGFGMQFAMNDKEPASKGESSSSNYNKANNGAFNNYLYGIEQQAEEESLGINGNADEKASKSTKNNTKKKGSTK